MFAPSGAIDNRSDLSLAHGQDLTHEVERATDEHVALHAGKLPGTIECRLRRYDCFGIVTEYRSQRYSRNRVAGSAGRLGEHGTVRLEGLQRGQERGGIALAQHRKGGDQSLTADQAPQRNT